MNKYIPLTPDDRKVMLDRIGVESVDDLFSDIPEELQDKGQMDINDPMSEIQVRKTMRDLGARNKNLNDYSSFLGAGSYDHYIPSTVKHVYSRSEFYTSYTPYQPEISQGTLQYIFEYQSMMAELTGMDVINASMYDGATAAAEAAIMAVRIKKKNRIAVSSTIHPETMRVLETYCHFREIELVKIPESHGRTCSDSLDCIDADTSAVIVQSPNFYGIIEDLTQVEKRVHDNKGLLIMSVDPISLGLLKTPGEWGADIVVGEGQSLGMNQSFGGPYLGFIGTTTKHMRKLPGRICGMTEDMDGKPGYVLTLQAREQHIRREKATSNICSNQSLCALMAVTYLSTMGKEGIKAVAGQCMTKAEYARKKLLETGKFNPVYDGPVFKEFVLESKMDPERLNDALFEKGIIGPLDMKRVMENHDNHVLFAVTEKRTRSEIDRLVEIIREVE